MREQILNIIEGSQGSDKLIKYLVHKFPEDYKKQHEEPFILHYEENPMPQMNPEKY